MGHSCYRPLSGCRNWAQIQILTAGQESSAAPASGRQTGLLSALTQQRSLPSVIAAAVTAGNLTLDDAQRDYLHALMGEPVPVMQSAAAPGTGAEHSAGMSHHWSVWSA